MRVLVTGAAGFIGMHLTRYLLQRGDEVIGIDNLNDYYAVSLKEARLQHIVDADTYGRFQFMRMDLADRAAIAQLFADIKPDTVVNLAAQAGVRYSIDNPLAYIDSNLVGFANILEGCRHHAVKHLVYASSSSVYGANESMPFSVHDNVDHPLSLYAASKKANELMAHTYSHLYGLPTTGLRFFTVYGPWGRPDMALFKFTKAILEDKPIDVFNYGKHRRDFTYIDDIIQGIDKILEDKNIKEKYQLYNIGNSKPVQLMDFIKEVELSTGEKAILEMYPMQAGDVNQTWADVQELKDKFGYNPNYPVDKGVYNFVQWYRKYYNK